LANRIVFQKTERFKNKQVLFSGSKQHPMGCQIKLSVGLSHVSFKILAYACYLHEGISLLKRISRSAFIMTQNKELLALFTKKFYEVPLYSNNSLLYFQPS